MFFRNSFLASISFQRANSFEFETEKSRIEIDFPVEHKIGVACKTVQNFNQDNTAYVWPLVIAFGMGDPAHSAKSTTKIACKFVLSCGLFEEKVNLTDCWLIRSYSCLWKVPKDWIINNNCCECFIMALKGDMRANQMLWGSTFQQNKRINGYFFYSAKSHQNQRNSIRLMILGSSHQWIPTKSVPRASTGLCFQN